MKIKISSIDWKGSLNNGPGVRVVIFLQGCQLRCEGCHNESTWDENCGTSYEISDIVRQLTRKVKNKKVTISGGEPFFQSEATMSLVKELFDNKFDICLYTGSELCEVKRDFPAVLTMLKYIKVGRYKKELRVTTLPYVGSSNQCFYQLFNGEIL